MALTLAHVTLANLNESAESKIGTSSALTGAVFSVSACSRVLSFSLAISIPNQVGRSVIP